MQYIFVNQNSIKSQAFRKKNKMTSKYYTIKRKSYSKLLIFTLISILFTERTDVFGQKMKSRVIVTTDGEVDDKASMVRFLLMTHEFDVEGIINSSSQFHWVGGQGWNAFQPIEWVKEYINLYVDVYENNQGAFNAEGDTPAFLHTIPNGLRSIESPGYGGWAGRYVKVRNNVWMDPPPDSSYVHPIGQWGFTSSWSKKMEHDSDSEKVVIRTNYFKPMWRWLKEVQNDFAAHADRCVKDYASANHHPIVRLKNTPLNMIAKAGDKAKLDASETIDPDNDILSFKWWHYSDAESSAGKPLVESVMAKTTITIPEDALSGDTIHMICEVTDSGTPALTHYQRVIITVIP